jgi:uncharacterized protein YbjT (DUF2867 family)
MGTAGTGILIVGASGLVGQGALQAALQDASIARIVLLTRRPLATADPRVRIVQADPFSDENLARLDLGGLDACFYCAGALPVGMGEAAYRALTVDLTLRVARAYAAANPGGRLLYISGLGADARSRLMPLKVKGEAEDALRQLGIPVCCLRPGVVRPVQGERSPHAARRWVYGLGSPFLALGCRLAPRLFTTSRAVGMTLLRVARMTQMPAVVENAAIQETRPH